MYFGGGAPTALPANLFFDLLETICNELPLSPQSKITLKSTNTDLNSFYLERLPGSAINRVNCRNALSSGRSKKIYNRKANFQEIQQKVSAIKKAGITNICADLMYNLEGQTDENWNEDLWFIEKLGFTGCSIYPLLPFPNAPLVKSGKYNAPHPENEYRLFKLADVFLTSLPDWEAITAVQYGHKSHGNAKYVELPGR